MVSDRPSGRVLPGPERRPLVSYFMRGREMDLVHRGLEILIATYRAAGARRVFPMINKHWEVSDDAAMAGFRAARLRGMDLELAAFHPLGTARMGVNPATSFVGEDFQAHDIKDLHVVDGSVVPSSPSANPQMTIMAFATRAAEILDERL
jgi:choline dehydrogenase-like flavoprotein